MSEPLYRIWDIEAQTFIPQDNYKWYVGMEGFVRNRDGFVSQAHFIIQRCTGEIVNDKYIYEGDIVEHYPNASATIRAIVRFQYGNFVVEDLLGYEDITVQDIDKIIGNNLENPELLLEKEE